MGCRQAAQAGVLCDRGCIRGKAAALDGVSERRPDRHVKPSLAFISCIWMPWFDLNRASRESKLKQCGVVQDKERPEATDGLKM